MAITPRHKAWTHWLDHGLWLLAFACVMALATVQLQQAAEWRLPDEDRGRWLQPPLRSWPGSLEPGEWADWAGRRVQMTGFYRFNRDFFLGQETRDGVSGVYLITPLMLGDGRALLVNRGWIPDRLKDPAQRAALARPTGPQMVEGVLHLPPQAPPGSPIGSRDNPHWHTIDRTVMQEWLCGSPTPPLLVEPATRVDSYGPQTRYYASLITAILLYVLGGALITAHVMMSLKNRKRKNHA